MDNIGRQDFHEDKMIIWLAWIEDSGGQRVGAHADKDTADGKI